MKICQLSAEAALASLQTGPGGLDEHEAARRLTEYGPNAVEPLDRQPVWRLLLAQFGHFFALILWLAAGLAWLAYRRHGDPAMATLALAIVGVILLNGSFSFWQEYKAERALSALRELLPLEVKVRRADRARRLPAEQLVPGDVLHLEAGDAVPADCRLLTAYGLRVNNAILTGESAALSRDAEPSAEADPLLAGNVLFAGTSVMAGEAEAVVYATGMRTRFGHIAHLTQTAGDTGSPLVREITRLSHWVAAFTTALGGLFFVVGLALGLSWNDNLLFAIGIIVANVPEGLLPTVSLSLALACQRMAKRQALVRHAPAVEALGSATVIVSDKTGTLTENRMRVLAVYAEGQEWAPAAPELPAVLREIAGHCHSLLVSGSGWLGDPMEVALAEFAGGQACLNWPRRAELPFDSARKRMAVVHERPEGLRMYVKGAAESVLPLCRQGLRGGALRELSAEDGRQLTVQVDAMARRGLRVLALAYKDVAAADATEDELVFAGLAGIEDPPRPEVPEAIASCHRAGIRVILCTGDHPVTAVAIAGQIGLLRGAAQVLTGEAMAHLSDTELQLYLDRPDLIFARTAPEQKQRLVEALQRKGEIVAVTGDGVNDAPALRRADIGVAMGRSGTDVAKAAADIVLLDDNFATLVYAIEEGRAVYANIRKFLTYILSSNIPELVPYLAFVLFGIPLPLTIVQVLAVDLGTDMLPALALGTEPPDANTMREPPRPRGEHLLAPGLAARAYGFLGMFEAAAALCAYFVVLQGGGWQFGLTLAPQDPLYRTATTACLAAIVLAQVANLFLCRHDTASLARQPLRNRWLAWGLAFELGLLLAIIYTPAGQALFGTAPLPLAGWLAGLPVVLAMVLAEEARKAWVRLHPRPRKPAPAARRQVHRVRPVD